VASSTSRFAVGKIIFSSWSPWKKKKKLAMLHRDWPHFVPLAPFTSACIHDHWCPLIVSQREIKIAHAILNADYKQSLCWLLLLCIVLPWPWTIQLHLSTISTSCLTLGGTPLELVYQFGCWHSGLLLCWPHIHSILHSSSYSGTGQFKRAI
jgi:hypothetical protein